MLLTVQKVEFQEQFLHYIRANNRKTGNLLIGM